MTSVERAVQFVLREQSLADATRVRLRGVLATLVAQAQRSHPTITVDIVDFVRRLLALIVERLASAEDAASADTDDEAELAAGAAARLAVDDLYLAFGCECGDAAALHQLERSVMPQLARELGRVGLGGSDVDDCLQGLRTDIAASGAQPSLLARYGGRGRLMRWLRVTALRRALREARASDARSRASEEERLAGAVTSRSDAELAFLKTTYREPFRRAFRAALLELSPRQQNVIRYYFANELTAAQVAMIYGVHESTAYRWLVRAQEQLLGEIKARLQRELRISDSECESVIRLVKSDLRGTIVSFMQAAPSEDPDES